QIPGAPTRTSRKLPAELYLMRGAISCWALWRKRAVLHGALRVRCDDIRAGAGGEVRSRAQETSGYGPAFLPALPATPRTDHSGSVRLRSGRSLLVPF